MRIAWFTHRYYPCVGGAETYGRAMVRRFVARGDEVDVLTSDALDLWSFTDRRRCRVDAPGESVVDGARVRRFALRHWPLQKYVGRALSYVPHWPTRCRFESYMPILPGIERVRGDYDAVFALGFPYTIFSYAAYRTARAAGAPLILTPFLHLATPGDPVHRHYTRPHQIRLLHEADLVVVQTPREADAVLGWGLAPQRVLILGMGVDHAEVTGGDGSRLRSRLGVSPEAQVVGHLATLDPNKGSTDLVRAVARINEYRHHDDPIRLLLAGSTSPEFEAFEATLPESSKRWITKLGPMSSEQKPDFFDALDVFAMPSRTDSFGIVFLEAWANGKPVVAADAGGVPDVIAHERDGLLVPFGDVLGLASAIDRLLNDPATARMLGDAGRAKVSRGYTWDDRFATLLKRIQDVMTSTRATPRPDGGGWRCSRLSRVMLSNGGFRSACAPMDRAFVRGREW